MVERRKIAELWRRGVGQTLVTLVRAEGSSYRRTGARLLIGGGDSAGTISGGCLEAEVVRRAEWMIRSGAVVERYSMLFDDTAEVPFGLGCGGVVDLLLESVATSEADALLRAIAASLQGEVARVVSFLPGKGKGLKRVIFGADAEVIFSSESLSQERVNCARTLIPGHEYEGRFVEELRPPQRLFVLGAGDDAMPVVNMASLLGWAVTVADGRSQLARSQRFPGASHVVVIQEARQLEIVENDAVVIMTHSYEQDRTLLGGLLGLPQPPRYLGLLGARHRSSLLISEAAAMLDRPIAWCCDRLFAPVGLDLGGDGAEAIALAVVAEVQAFCEGRLGDSRRLSEQDVLEQVARQGASRYLQAQCGLGVA